MWISQGKTGALVNATPQLQAPGRRFSVQAWIGKEMGLTGKHV